VEAKKFLNAAFSRSRRKIRGEVKTKGGSENARKLKTNRQGDDETVRGRAWANKQ